MKVFSVHQAPKGKETTAGAADAAADTVSASENITFIRDGFSTLAFLAPIIWLLWYRLWFWAAAYLAGIFLLEGGIAVAGLPRETSSLTVLLNLLVGLEGNNLRRRVLQRQGWSEIGISSGSNFAECETRFFVDWVARRNEAEAARKSRLAALLEHAGGGERTSVPVTAGAFYHSKGGHA